MNIVGYVFTTGHSANYERGTIGRVAADEYVLGVFRMLWLQKSHRQQHEFGLDDFGLAPLYHDGPTALWIGFPVNLLHLHTCQLTILAQELQGVDVPATGATLLVA